MEIKQQIQQYLKSGNTVYIAKVERELSFESIITMKGIANFGQLTKPQEKEVLTHIHTLSNRFFNVNFPDANSSEVAAQFAVDILESRKHWTLYDVIYFFKFIRQRQDLEELKIFGNAFKITPIVLSRLVSVYEEHKSYAMDNVRSKIEFKPNNQIQLLEAIDIKLKDAPRDNRFRELYKILEKKEEEKSDFIAKAALTKQFHKDNDFCLEWLKKQDATDKEKLIWYNIFQLRKLK